MSKKHLKRTDQAVIGQRGKPVAVTSQLSYQSGPIPSPETLAGYNAIVPGAAERILAMAERQSAHRMGLESNVIQGDLRRASAGLWLGGLVAVFAMATAGFMAWAGHPVSGTIIGGGTLASLVGTFVYGSQIKRQDQAKR